MATPEDKLQHGTYLINEFGAFKPQEQFDFPEDVDCLKLWTKARL